MSPNYYNNYTTFVHILSISVDAILEITFANSDNFAGSNKNTDAIHLFNYICGRNCGQFQNYIIEGGNYFAKAR